MKSNSFELFAGLCAILAGVSGFLYAVSFVVLKDPFIYSLFLMLTGLFSVVALIGTFLRLQDVDAGFAFLALLFGAIGTVGAAIHGGYDLANAINPPASNLANLADLPSQVDPRGLLTFGFAGIGVFFFAWMMTHSAKFPRALGYLGYLVALLSVELYLARMIILAPTNPVILVPVLVAGFIVNPIWYLWLGLTLRKGT